LSPGRSSACDQLRVQGSSSFVVGFKCDRFSKWVVTLLYAAVIPEWCRKYSKAFPQQCYVLGGTSLVSVEALRANSLRRQVNHRFIMHHQLKTVTLFLTCQDIPSTSLPLLLSWIGLWIGVSFF
jgi:hypothetical protein